MPALISVDELIESGAVRAGNVDNIRESLLIAILDASAKICGGALTPQGGYTRRRLRAAAEAGSPAVPAYTEYHTLERCTRDLFLLDWPVVDPDAVVIHEDSSWESREVADRYGADTLLEAGVDYIVSASSGKIVRVGATWATGWRAIKVQYTAGYALADVPGRIKRVAKELVARMRRDDVDRWQGVAARTDGTGTTTRMLPSELTTMDEKSLNEFRRPPSLGAPVSGVRDEEPADVEDP